MEQELLSFKVLFKKSLNLQIAEKLFSNLTLFTTVNPYKVTYRKKTLPVNDIQTAFEVVLKNCADSDFSIELAEGINAIKYIRCQYNYFIIQVPLSSYNTRVFNIICNAVVKAQGLLLLRDNVCCPRCDGQGQVEKVKIDGLPDRIYLCEECDAMWDKDTPILKSTYRSLKELLDERGISYGRAKREYEGYYTESDVIEEIENASK